MIELTNIEVFNIEGAIRGMRNPMNSWDQSDSFNDFIVSNGVCYKGDFILGDKDIDLAKRLIKAGTDHSKFMRQILFSLDINAPLYFFKEYDTYKVATVANSTSTMHKLGSKYIDENDFSFEDVREENKTILLKMVNDLIQEYQETKSKKVWRELIQILPSGFMQLRTWTANYATLRNIYFARKNHKLIEWHAFCEMIENLPYSELITIEK